MIALRTLKILLLILLLGTSSARPQDYPRAEGVYLFSDGSWLKLQPINSRLQAVQFAQANSPGIITSFSRSFQHISMAQMLSLPSSQGNIDVRLAIVSRTNWLARLGTIGRYADFEDELIYDSLRDDLLARAYGAPQRFLVHEGTFIPTRWGWDATRLTAIPVDQFTTEYLIEEDLSRADIGSLFSQDSPQSNLRHEAYGFAVQTEGGEIYPFTIPAINSRLLNPRAGGGENGLILDSVDAINIPENIMSRLDECLGSGGCTIEGVADTYQVHQILVAHSEGSPAKAYIVENATQSALLTPMSNQDMISSVDFISENYGKIIFTVSRQDCQRNCTLVLFVIVNDEEQWMIEFVQSL